MSVSELSDWFTCPYKRFLRDAVGVKERRDGVLAAPDFGTVVHEFMKTFIDHPPYELSRERVKKTVDEILCAKGIEPEPYAYERLLDD
ncbi:MAG: PD-(D/E)XK nuclease family protein, partial [Clostridia bacterium]|nr:PD-(D/E)XK nuclease family protein [Clostridia bacterium]